MRLLRREERPPRNDESIIKRMKRPCGRFSGWMEEDRETLSHDKDYLRVEVLFLLSLMAAIPTG